VITQITTHIEDAQARMLEQYQDKPNFLNLFDILGDVIQDAEDYFYEMFDMLNINLAEGVWLDVLGTIVDQNRQVFSIGVDESAFILDTSLLDSDAVLDGITSRLDDVQYRKYIQGKIFKNFVRLKNIDAIYRLIDGFLEPDVLNINEYTAKVSISIGLGGDTAKYRILNSLIAENPNWVGVPAGVQIEWSIADYK